MQGIVLSKNADLFTVESEEGVFKLKPSGKTKASGIFVGDRVVFSDAITEVKERKNLLVRPPLANVDKCFIVICPIPKPDFVLVDKVIVYCLLKGIQPIIVVNKIDLAEQSFLDEIAAAYKSFEIVKVSAKNGLVSELVSHIDGVCTLAGQSAVGKSSIINALFADQLEKVGQLSKKTERGRQTTRLVTLYKTENGYLADTAGFSLLDLSFVSDIDYRELSAYYPDFLQARAECKYRSCLHEGGDCGVIEAVKQGRISKLRYQNYLKILSELRNAKKF